MTNLEEARAKRCKIRGVGGGFTVVEGVGWDAENSCVNGKDSNKGMYCFNAPVEVMINHLLTMYIL